MSLAKAYCGLRLAAIAIDRSGLCHAKPVPVLIRRIRALKLNGFWRRYVKCVIFERRIFVQKISADAYGGAGLGANFVQRKKAR
jgi:hypothetical protein